MHEESLRDPYRYRIQVPGYQFTRLVFNTLDDGIAQDITTKDGVSEKNIVILSQDKTKGHRRAGGVMLFLYGLDKDIRTHYQTDNTSSDNDKDHYLVRPTQ